MPAHVQDGLRALDAHADVLLAGHHVQLLGLQPRPHRHGHADLMQRLRPAVAAQVGATPSVGLCSSGSTAVTAQRAVGAGAWNVTLQQVYG
jgi:hypothetical protein